MGRGAPGAGSMSDERINASDRIGVVAIGRNEGERLRKCLESVIGCAAAVVYVDSGSMDGSIAIAAELGVDVVELDLSKPFSAARARNEGIRRLRSIAPDLQYVQVVDGDCEVVEGWMESAAEKVSLAGLMERALKANMPRGCGLEEEKCLFPMEKFMTESGLKISSMGPVYTLSAMAASTRATTKKANPMGKAGMCIATEESTRASSK